MRAVRQIAFIALTTSGIGCASGATAPAADVQAFERKLEALQALARIPGISAGIARGPDVVWTRGFGLADVAANRPATDTTVYHLASLTKPFASVMLMQMVNEGKIALDDPVSQYGINMNSQGTIRVRHLMSHTSSEMPGSIYRYDGDRFSQLDSVFVRADGRSFASALYARIITPLGLKWIAPNPGSVFFALSGKNAAEYQANFAKGYGSDLNRTQTPYPGLFSSAAGLTASVHEMLRFSIALDQGTLLPDNLKTLMFTPTTTTGGQVTPYGLGWFSTEYKGVRVVWHYGLWTAISSLIVKVPDRQLTFVVLANTEGLSLPYPLAAGHLERSPWARAFLDAFVVGNAPLP